MIAAIGIVLLALSIAMAALAPKAEFVEQWGLRVMFAGITLICLSIVAWFVQLALRHLP